MNKKQTELLNRLQSASGPLKGAHLAEMIGVSPRSIKNYVHEINGLYGQPVILSSSAGYRLSQKGYQLLTLLDEEEDIPQTQEERAFYIIKQLILQEQQGLDLYDLADYLGLGYSSIKAVVSRMNKSFSGYNVEFYWEDDILHIRGSESSCRKLVSYVINEEAKTSFVSLDLLKENFPQLDVTGIYILIQQVYKEHGFYLNDFAGGAMLMHILIMMDRRLQGSPLESGETEFEYEYEQERELLEDLKSRIEETYSVHFNPFELFEMYMLYRAYGNMTLDSSASLSEAAGIDLVNFVDEITSSLNSIYLVNLCSPAFKAPFVLHIKNLIYRSRRNQPTRNPMAASIRTNSPLVFEMAVYTAMQIMDRYNITVTEDETAFLALHIGGELERQIKNKEKAPAVLICPRYRDMASRLANDLLMHFGNQIKMDSILHSESEFASLYYGGQAKIVFTAIDLNGNYEGSTIIHVNPMTLSSQLSEIEEILEERQKNYQDNYLRIQFPQYFEKDLFLYMDKASSREEILEKLFEKLKNKGYIDEDFIDSVKQREQAADRKSVV